MDHLISVIVPAYNAAAYLDNCVDSILRQSYKEIEIVIVDDGSTDATGETAERLSRDNPGRIKCIHQENSGVTTARLNGVLASSGEWIGFTDADDELEPDIYERLISNALRYQADISHCGHQTIVNGGERVHYFYNTGRLAVQKQQDALIDLLDGAFEPSLCTKLFRRELFAAFMAEKAFDPTIKYNEDLLMNFFLFSKADSVVYEDFCGYHYIANGDSATRNQFRIEKLLDPVKVRKIILDHIEPELREKAWRLYLDRCTSVYAALLNKPAYKNEAQAIKDVLMDNRDKWYLLRKPQRIKLYGSVACPKLFTAFFRFYVKHFQKKKYE